MWQCHVARASGDTVTAEKSELYLGLKYKNNNIGDVGAIVESIL